MILTVINNMQYRKLSWDSEFFGKEIFALESQKEDSPLDVISFLRQKKYDLCYVFCPYINDYYWSQLYEIGGRLYDRKVFYGKILDLENISNQYLNDVAVRHIMEISAETNDSIALAVRSGWKSRFKKDPRLSDLQPELYRRWLVKDIVDKEAKVYGYYDDNMLLGLACTSVSNDLKLGKLDLIAVSDNNTKTGIGSVLLEMVEDYWLDNNCEKGQIITQQDNVIACHFYEKHGYAIQSIQEVWHIWS